MEIPLIQTIAIHKYKETLSPVGTLLSPWSVPDSTGSVVVSELDASLVFDSTRLLSSSVSSVDVASLVLESA